MIYMCFHMPATWFKQAGAGATKRMGNFFTCLWLSLTFTSVFARFVLFFSLLHTAWALLGGAWEEKFPYRCLLRCNCCEFEIELEFQLDRQSPGVEVSLGWILKGCHSIYRRTRWFLWHNTFLRQWSVWVTFLLVRTHKEVETLAWR